MAPPPPPTATIFQEEARAGNAPLPVAPPPGPQRPAESAMAGAGLIICSTFFFALGDITSKSLTDSLHGLQVAWFRFALFVMIVPPLVLFLRGPAGLATRRIGAQLLRGVFICGSSVLFILGLASLPVAETTAIAYLGPLFITALSIPLLGEKVGARRWAAAVVGFLGVLLVARPGSEAFQLSALFPVAAAFAGALASIMTRRMADEAPETTLAWTATIGFLMTSLLVPLVWAPLDGRLLLVGIVSGVLSTVGHVFMVLAFRRASASTIAPFTYVQLLFAAVLSFMAFGAVPSALTLAGMAVIAASGLYTAHRERVRARERAAAS